MLQQFHLPSPWCLHETCLFRDPGVPASQRIAAFDFDGTLRFGGSAWRFTSSHLPSRLASLVRKGYKCVIFSNQARLLSKARRDPFEMERALYDHIERFETFADFVGFDTVPFQMFLALARGDIKDYYRKPDCGMWDLMLARNCGFEVDLEASFYVGNNAGRTCDASNSDRQFAERVGVRFYTENVLTETWRGAGIT